MEKDNFQLKIKESGISMLRFKSQLIAYLKDKYDPGLRIAVEPLIFTKDKKLILITRGNACRDEIDKLECPGGDIGPHEDLYEALQSRVRRKLGTTLTVRIVKFLDVRKVIFTTKDNIEVTWIIVSYLCEMMDGCLPQDSPVPQKVQKIQTYAIDELEPIESTFSRSTMKAILQYNDQLEKNI